MSTNFKVTKLNNFCRVFELPLVFSGEFCFGGPIPTTFYMVDWFNPVFPPAGIGGDLPESVDYDWIQENTVQFVLKKPYIRLGRKYMILFDFGASVIIGGEKGEVE